MTPLDKKALDFFREAGRKGGMKTLKRHGKKHFKRISPANSAKLEAVDNSVNKGLTQGG
jgi:hypothetical protein